MFQFSAKDEHDTLRLGVAIATALPPGSVVGLLGPLGAGKTRLVQAVAVALGVTPGTVTSPTFVLVNEYRGGRMPVYHFDTYRLKNQDEFWNLGPEEYFDGDGITFVEWADRVSDMLPEDRLEVTIDVISDIERRFTVRGTSTQAEEFVRRIAAVCDST
jgi:tRNA threonylcarbamoyladenosine biosynthesis protein TsaE